MAVTIRENTQGPAFSAAATVARVWKATADLAARYPSLLLPFAAIGAGDMLVLLFMYLLPRTQLAAIAAPAVAAVWGEEALHYPGHLMVLPKMFTFGRDVLGFVTGTVFTAVGVSMMNQVSRGEAPGWRPGLRKIFRKPGAFLLVWTVPATGVMAIMEGVRHLQRMFGELPALAVGGYIASVAVHMVFAFAVPAVVVENRKAGAALGRSLSVFRALRAETAAVILLPYLLVAPMMLFYAGIDRFVQLFTPDVVFYALGLRTVIMVLVNYFVVTAVTLLFLTQRGRERGRVGGV